MSTDKTTRQSPVYRAAKLMVGYWSDRDDEPHEDDIALVRRMEAILCDPGEPDENGVYRW